jgi:hypothetical protein
MERVSSTYYLNEPNHLMDYGMPYNKLLVGFFIVQFFFLFGSVWSGLYMSQQHTWPWNVVWLVGEAILSIYLFRTGKGVYDMCVSGSDWTKDWDTVRAAQVYVVFSICAVLTGVLIAL